MITAHQPSLSTYGNEEIVDVCETNPVKDVFREKTSGVAFEFLQQYSNYKTEAPIVAFMWLISVKEGSLARSLDVCVAHVIIWMRSHNR